MKILIICEFFPIGKELKFSGGVEARTFFVSKSLSKKHNVHVITTRLPNSKQFEKINGISVHRIGPIKNYRTGAKLSDLISLYRFTTSAIKEGSKLNPQIVEGTNFVTHFIAKQISQKNRTPLVFWYPDVFIGNWIKTSGLVAGLIGNFVEKFNLKRSADLFIAISNSTKSKLIRNKIPQNKIIIIPCGVDLGEFKGQEKKLKDPTIVCISRLVSYKRVEDLIWAYAKVQKSITNLKLIIVGRGPQEKKLKTMTQMLKISQRVLFKKNLKRNDLVRTLQSSELFCLPSETEGFGISVIEAAAAKVPFVITDIPVFKEITKEGAGGLLFKTGDIGDLSSKIEKLLNDRNLYKKKSEECSKLSKEYDWSKIAAETESLYSSLIKK